MKAWICLFLMAAAITAGCTGAPESVTVGVEENGTEVAVALGGQVTIRLPEDPSTGDEWQTDLSDGLVVVDERRTPGWREWTVEAFEPGTHRFSAYLTGRFDPPSSAEEWYTISLRFVG
ncbi:protease inhibitor I42 family protein [Methanofollis fontis]|uniref:Proteinase inhibitor I42 chagasin domain-containing protein n=1 Tax=Methanofollis fontis TaxID=2052832 RepID=A0A483CYS8_9EURY|nr:protease inhibitor I42 family protein [Methanofollis fontis]TAJ44926.1 hypothetical protein CUJ86_06505 [Methanofollis fontis]